MMKSERLVFEFLKDIESHRALSFQKRNFEFWSSKSPQRSSSFLNDKYWKDQISRAKEEFDNDTAYRFTFSLFDDPEIILGYVNFSQVFRGIFQACYVGYAIEENFQGKGLTTEALKLLINYMFETQNIHRIMANYMPHNKSSARVLEKLGFVTEGQAKDYLYINGKWKDHVLTSLSNQKWVDKNL